MKIASSLALALMVVPSILLLPVVTAPVALAEQAPADLRDLKTDHARLKLDDKGFVISLVGLANGKEYVPAGHPSPLLSLHEDGSPNATLLAPVSAAFRPEKGQIALTYANGSVATVEVAPKSGYIRFKLAELAHRGKVDNVVWGPLKTVIGKEGGRIGDIIGVVRDPDFAIGMIGVDDNTIAGPVADGDCFTMGYTIHSPDPKKHPVPEKYKEGQWFSIGGNGVSDTAFFSHPEEYFQWIAGNGAKLEPEFGSTVAYHARDRRKSYHHFYSIMGGHQAFRPRHMTSDPLPGVDFIGSTVTLYACPDDLGLAVLEKIHKDEGMPFITDADGKWIRDLAAVRPTLWWNGPVDNAIEYAKAMGFKNISRDTGEFYPARPPAGSTGVWMRNLGLANGKTITYKEFGDQCRAAGLTHGGLHTLCMFLQGGAALRDLDRLQTVCRTKLAKDISPTDTEIVVTDPAFLADKGTWTRGDGSNVLRIGGEMLRYEGISESAPWTLKGVKRGHGTKAQEHKAGDELVKLMQNCYNGFVPDMSLVLDYADYYANLMVGAGMDDIGFDGYETLMYQNHGYYAMKVFNRRLFDTYRRQTGRWPHITTASNIFGGSWEYLASCNLGGGGNMFNIPARRWATEGKDIRNAFGNSWYPPSMGGQGWSPGWSLYDAENLISMATAWDATFGLSVTQANIDATGDKDAILKAYKAWMDARGQQAFTKEQKERLKQEGQCFHLEQTGEKTFVLHPVAVTRTAAAPMENPGKFTVANAGEAQPLWFDLLLNCAANGAEVTLPDGGRIKCDQKLERGQRIVCHGDRAWLTDKTGNKKAVDLDLKQPAKLAQGESRIGVKLELDKPGKINVGLTTYVVGKGEPVGK